MICKMVNSLDNGRDDSPI